MDELEHELVFNESLEEGTKIFRNQSITCIDDLSNEIFYEIFDYFDGCEMVEKFSNLNSRFKQLLHSSLLLTKTHFYLFHYQEMTTTFNGLEIFSTKICPNLKILSIICSSDITFLDAHRWERLILHYYPQLEKFYLTYYDRMDSDNQYQMYSGRVDQFSSTFWIQRKWIFHVKIDDAEIKYMIYPYRKPWYDYSEHNNIEYSTSTTLLLTNFPTFSYDEMIYKEIKRVITITQIYHLDIPQKDMLIYVIIQLIHLLPNLITLKVHSLSFNDTIELTTKEFVDVLLVMDQNKIKNVYLEQVNHIEDFIIIRAICPRMIHLKVKHINVLDIPLFFGDILEKINHSANANLRSLCFHMPPAADEMIHKLRTIINCKELSFQFTIEHILDYIYLKWK